MSYLEASAAAEGFWQAYCRIILSRTTSSTRSKKGRFLLRTIRCRCHSGDTWDGSKAEDGFPCRSPTATFADPVPLPVPPLSANEAKPSPEEELEKIEEVLKSEPFARAEFSKAVYKGDAPGFGDQKRLWVGRVGSKRRLPLQFATGAKKGCHSESQPDGPSESTPKHILDIQLV